MHRPPRPVSLLVTDLQQHVAPSPLRQQDPTLLETLSYGAHPVDRAVLMSLCACFRGDVSILLGGEVTAWKNVCGGKGGRGLDALQEQDLVRGRDEEDAT